MLALSLLVTDLQKSFGVNKAVDRLTFHAKPGKAFGLLGRNGAGKTTTIRSIIGLISFESGSILWKDKPIKVSRPKIGYLPEERGLYPKVTVIEQLNFFASLERMDKHSANKAIKYWLEKLNIEEYKKKKVEELSKGNQQKVQIISALLHDPELIILDEPFSGLDPVNSDLLSSIIKELLASNKTIIISSHQMHYIERFCEDICILKKGKTVLAGNLNDIKRSYGRNTLIIKSEYNAIKQVGGNVVDKMNNSWTIKVKKEDDAHHIIQELVNNKIKILGYEIKEPTLHEIFIDKVDE